MSNAFRGSYTVSITPFTEDGGAVDLSAQKRFLDWQIAEGVPGVIVLGTTGEFLTVSDEERRALVATTVDHVAGRMAVLVGAMNAHTPKRCLAPRKPRSRPPDGLMINTAVLLHAHRGRDYRLLPQRIARESAQNNQARV